MNQDAHKQAQEYVDRVLEAQRRSGHEPDISPEAYETAVRRSADGFASLLDRSERPDDDRVPA